MTLFIVRCNSPSEFQINIEQIECLNAEVDIFLESLEVYTDKGVGMSHADIAIELNMRAINNSSDTVKFTVDHDGYDYFNFKGIINFEGLRDTINFNSFQNPKVYKMSPSSTLDFTLGSYAYPFDQLPCDEKDIVDFFSNCFGNFKIFYKTFDGKEMCVNQRRELTVYLRN